MQFSISIATAVAFATGSEAVEVLSLAQDVNYPPYAFASESGEPLGFGRDVAMGVDAICEDLSIVVNVTKWENCWNGADGGKLGSQLEDGTFSGCMTYTHTFGVRNEFADFSYGILKLNKAAGLLTLLDEEGVPKVDGHDDLCGKIVVDVGGWAPTADGLDFVENKCTGTKYSSNYTILTGDGNDESMIMLRNGTADAMFVYSDQAENYQCNDDGVIPTWNCTLWQGFGTEYAYVQTGQFGHAQNGTTLAMAKKGSGIVEKINPCIQAFMETEEYYDLCVKHDLVDSCYENSFFPKKEQGYEKEYNLETDEHKTDCDNGYCQCPESSSTARTLGLIVSMVAGLVIMA